MDLARFSDEEIAQLGPLLDDLVADFRTTARLLITEYTDDCDEVEVGGETWWIHWHGDHCRFESDETGVVAEVCIDFPDDLDPDFLLQFAKSSGRHQTLLARVASFHAMDRLLNIIPPLGGLRPR